MPNHFRSGWRRIVSFFGFVLVSVFLIAVIGRRVAWPCNLLNMLVIGRLRRVGYYRRTGGPGGVLVRLKSSISGLPVLLEFRFLTGRKSQNGYAKNENQNHSHVVSRFTRSHGPSPSSSQLHHFIPDKRADTPSSGDMVCNYCKPWPKWNSHLSYKKYSNNMYLMQHNEKNAKMDLSRTETMGRERSLEELNFGEDGRVWAPGSFGRGLHANPCSWFLRFLF